jgi:hypothetical protein
MVVWSNGMIPPYMISLKYEMMHGGDKVRILNDQQYILK